MARRSAFLNPHTTNEDVSTTSSEEIDHVTEELVLRHDHDSVATLTLNRPDKLNSRSAATSSLQVMGPGWVTRTGSGDSCRSGA